MVFDLGPVCFLKKKDGPGFFALMFRLEVDPCDNQVIVITDSWTSRTTEDSL